MKLKLLFALIASIQWLILCSCQQDLAMELRFDTSSKDPLAYQIDGRLKAMMAGDSVPSALNVRFSLELHREFLTAYDDGSARYRLASQSLSYHSDQRSLEECKYIESTLKNQQTEFKMNSYGELLEVDDDSVQFIPGGSLLDLQRLMVKLQPVLPGTKIKKGSTWETEQTLPTKSGKNGTIYKWFRIEDIYEKDQKQMASIQFNLKYRMGSGADNGVAFESDEFILGSGKVIFDVGHGWIESADIEIDGNMQAKMPALASADSQKVPEKMVEIPPLRVRQILNMRKL